MLELRGYLDSYIVALRRLDLAGVTRLAQLLFAAWRGRHTVFLCGNGGSAANAAHMATDLTKLAAPPSGPRLRAVALGESVSSLSAVANDLAFEQVFAEQLRAFLSPNDLVIGLSTSGSSPNVLRAVEYANEAGGVTIGITGLRGQPLRSRVHHPLVVSSESVQSIEDATMVVGHMACLLARDLILASTGNARGLLRSGPAAQLPKSPPGRDAWDQAPQADPQPSDRA